MAWIGANCDYYSCLEVCSCPPGKVPPIGLTLGSHPRLNTAKKNAHYRRGDEAERGD